MRTLACFDIRKCLKSKGQVLRGGALWSSSMTTTMNGIPGNLVIVRANELNSMGIPAGKFFLDDFWKR